MPTLAFLLWHFITFVYYGICCNISHTFFQIFHTSSNWWLWIRVFCILGDRNNAVICIVFILPLVSNSASLFSKPLRTVRSASTTIGIGVSFIFYILAFFHFHSEVHRNSKIHQITSSFFLLISTRSGFLTRIEWSICISKFQRILFVSISMTNTGLYIYRLTVWSYLNNWNTC